MSIMDLFRTPAPPQPLSGPQQAVAANAQQPGGNPTSQDANPTVPNANTPKSDGAVAAIPAAAEGDASPLAAYKDIWKTAPTSPNVADLIPSITADPAAMMAAAKTIDFTKVIDPAMLALASKGDATAFAGVINAAAQAGYAQSSHATVNIVKAALAKQSEAFETKYAPAMQRQNNVSEAVNSSVLLASDPAVAPIVTALTRQISATFPTASGAEVATHVQKYLDELANKAITNSGGQVRTKEQLAPQPGHLQRADTDWEKFFDEVV